jgi:hypothetical protein
MNKTQKGFALLEGLLIILILVIIAFGGYYVWHSQKNDNKNTTSISSSTPADATKKDREQLTLANDSVTLSLPDGWIKSPINEQNGCQTDGTDNPIQDNCIDGVFLLPKSKQDDPNNREDIMVSVYTLKNSETAQKWYDSDFCQCITSGVGDKTEQIKINGYDAYYYEQGPSANGEYLDENYSVVNNGKAVLISSRVKEKDAGTDFTANIPLIKSLAESVKIN